MQTLFCKPFLLAAPSLNAGQASHSALPVSRPVQQHSFLLHRHCPPLALMENAFAVEASLQDPSPSALPPIQAPNLTDFTLVSLGLLLLFWFGNYVVPDFVFNKLPDARNTRDAEKQKVVEGLVGGTDKASSQGQGAEELGSSKEGTARGTGFGERVSKARK